VSVPRKPVDQVVEQRVTLGDKERQLLAAAIGDADHDRDLVMALDIAKAVAMPVSVLAVGYLVYLGMTNWGSLLDPLKDTRAAAAAEQAAAAFTAGAGLTDDPAGLTPEQIQAMANPLNPFARPLTGLGAALGWLF
jgi:hypothetical protein